MNLPFSVISLCQHMFYTKMNICRIQFSFFLIYKLSSPPRVTIFNPI